MRTSLIPPTSSEKTRMGSMTTTCSALFCVGSPATCSQCHSEQLPVEKQLPSVMCDLLSLILSPRAEPHVYFYAAMNAVLGKSHVSGCEQRLLTDRLLQHCSHSTCLLTPHSPPHRDHVPQHMEGCGVSTEPSWCSSMKPRHTENRKTKALL